MTIFRLIKIIIVFKSYGIIALLNNFNRYNYYLVVINIVLCWVKPKMKSQSHAVRLRAAFEDLGPIYVKFGQLLSTRVDLFPIEYLQELEQLQYQVTPFSSELSVSIIEQELAAKIDDIFINFSPNPVASASIAQVHKATLKSNHKQVAVKICRPNIKNIIAQDLKLMRLCAIFAKLIIKNSQQLRLLEILEEIKNTIFAELNFEQELANNLDLARMHKYDNKIIIPKVYQQFSTSKVLTMQWMNGLAINDIAQLKANKINLQRLSTNGIEIFYNQVFNFGFFHADMHPGNILCSLQGQFILLDFGIVGYLSEADKKYLAINILAFFHRDYRKVAITHVESGWAPANTNITQFERAIRLVCEPIFNKPLSQISFAQVLIKLFQVSRQFGVIVQPQLLLLQKTIVNIESLGRLINPELDLWVTAKPILNAWVKKQMGIKSFIDHIKQEMPYWPNILTTLPKELHKTLRVLQQQDQVNQQLIMAINKTNRNYFIILFILIVIIFVVLVRFMVARI